MRALQKIEGIEEIVIKKIEVQRLYKAIKSLPEIQRRRIWFYYFEDMTCEQIAEKERCFFQVVAKSIAAAERRMKKI